MVHYTQLANPALLEGGNGRFYEGRQAMQGSVMRLEPNRYYGA